MYFHKKPHHNWATKYESRRENESGRLAAVCLMHVDISSLEKVVNTSLTKFLNFTTWNLNTLVTLLSNTTRQRKRNQIFIKSVGGK